MNARPVCSETCPAIPVVCSSFTARAASAAALSSRPLSSSSVDRRTRTIGSSVAPCRPAFTAASTSVTAACTVNGQQVDAAAVLTADVQAMLAALGGAARANPIYGTVVDASGVALAGAVVNVV